MMYRRNEDYYIEKAPEFTKALPELLKLRVAVAQINIDEGDLLYKVGFKFPNAIYAYM